jgi:cysteine desulfurase
MYAPKGIGALFIRAGCQTEPLVLGAGHESGLRPGTENVPYIVGLAKACEIARRDGDRAGERTRKLRDRLWGMLKETIPGIVLNGHPDLRLPNTLNVRFPGVSGNALLAHCPEIAASTGSACHEDDESASAVIKAMGLTETEALGAVRLTLGRGTSKDDVTLAAHALLGAFEAIKANKAYISA